jgi:methyltransferase (TIGR00027 family)
MQDGRASQTAVMVTTARAVAHLEGDVPGFSDPTAMAWLPADARDRVEQIRAGAEPRSTRERFANEFAKGRARMMAVRTVAIDAEVRAASAPQLVILGAGFDGRAWRMPELRDVVVFEVDHPDTQRDKRARAAALPQIAREVRFLPVDFTRDRLDQKLSAAGHDPRQPTTWIWEGVVMYLTRSEIEATLAIIAERSTPGSRLIVAYAAPGWMVPLVRIILRRVGEPFRSVFRPPALKALLAASGFTVLRDQDIPTLGRALSERTWKATRTLKHIRIAVAERAR